MILTYLYARAWCVKKIAEDIISAVTVQVQRMKKTIGEVPGLGVILVGERKDSQIYVHNKMKACEEAGIKFALNEFSDKCTDEEVCNAIMRFNADPSFHGILVQLPLPQVIIVSQLNLNTSHIIV